MLHRKQETTGRKIEYRIFDSLDEFVRFAQAVPEHRLVSHDWPTRSSFSGRSFSGWPEVYKATREAWAEGLEVLDRMLTDLADAKLPKPTSRKRKPRFRDDDGDEVDFDRLRCGQSFWRTTRRQSTKGPATITILVDVAANCHVKHEDILWRGAAAVALTKLLEEAGYRVELWAVDMSESLWSNRSKGHCDTAGLMAVRLKAPGDALDVSTLISAVSGWAFRTVYFRSMCCEGKKRIDDALGYARAPSAADIAQITPDAKAVLIAHAFDYGEAVRQVREQLAKLTG
jgi:hypothetical protein